MAPHFIPQWSNEDAVCNLVEYELFLIGFEEEQRLLEAFPDGMPMSFFMRLPEEVEREAVNSAKRRDFRLMSNLLRPSSGEKKDRPTRRTFSQETWVLIADRLIGEVRPPRGRPKLTEEERRAMNPVHDAADAVEPIRCILANRYPERSKREILNRAIEIAQRLHGVRTDFATHLRRPKRDKRRV